MNEHDNDHAHLDTLDPERDHVQDAAPHNDSHTATLPPAGDGDAQRPARNAKPPRTRRRAAGHVPADLPALLHQHLNAMGPAEAVQALDALQRLASQPSADGAHVHPAWLTQLGAEIATHRDGPAIKRLVAMLVDLLPLTSRTDNDAAVGLVIGFARQQATAAHEAAANRQSRRR